MPRALKKSDGTWRRGSEFNVERPASSTTPAAKPAAASTTRSMLELVGKAVPPPSGKGHALPSWGGSAADLDDLVGGEQVEQKPGPDAKKPRREETASAVLPSQPADTSPEAAMAASVSDAASAADGVDEIIAAAPRLAQHIASVKKFNKVAAMVYSLFERGRVTPDNASAVFSVLRAGLSNPRACRARELAVAYRRLYTAACARDALFSPAERQAIDVWNLGVLTQMDLVTDDTFQFAAAVRRVKARLEMFPCIYPALEPEGSKHLPVAERRLWVGALFDCIDAAAGQHKYAWARTSVDVLIKAAVERRQNFSEEQQSDIQRWNAMCKGQKIVRQQQAARERSAKDLTSFERKEKEWREADISTNGGGGDAGGIDKWHANN